MPILATTFVVLLAGVFLYIGYLTDRNLAGQWPPVFFTLYAILGAITMLSPSFAGFRWHQVVIALLAVATLGVISKTAYTPRKEFVFAVEGIPAGSTRDEAVERMSEYRLVQETERLLVFTWEQDDPRFQDDQGRVFLDEEGRVRLGEFWPGWRVQSAMTLESRS